MLSLLEKLEESFSKKFRKEVELNEITIFSLQLSPKSAIVMTNSYVYTFKKRLIGLDLKKIPVNDISNAVYADADSIVITAVSGEKVVLDTQRKKRGLAKKAVNKIKLKLSQPFG